MTEATEVRASDRPLRLSDMSRATLGGRPSRLEALEQFEKAHGLPRSIPLRIRQRREDLCFDELLQGMVDRCLRSSGYGSGDRGGDHRVSGKNFNDRPRRSIRSGIRTLR